MTIHKTTICNSWEHPEIAEGFSHGVSLHSHTSYSRVSLEFIPKYARHSRFLGPVMDIAEWQYRVRTGNELDCSRAYWTPPLTPVAAARLEAAQIDSHFQLPAMVSLTDHDDCRAGVDTDGLISIEWTIPFAPSFFHLGVHNLPSHIAEQLVAEMKAYTARPNAEQLPEVLAALQSHREVLMVLNHPLWDEGLIGSSEHTALAQQFLRCFSPWIHALELNGLRSAAENQRVVALADAFGLPAISGGDRHGREPNANINLTQASSFAAFVTEIREDKISDIVYLPQYREPLRLRQFETAWDILRYDSDREDGCKSWCDRVFFTCERGITRPLSFFFGEAGPKILLPFLATMHLLEKRAVRPVLRAALSD